MLPLDPPSTLPSLVFLSVKRLGNKAYYHKLFVRDRIDLCRLMLSVKGGGKTTALQGQLDGTAKQQDASASSMMQLEVQASQGGSFHGRQPFSIPSYPEAAMLGANAASLGNSPPLAHHHAGNWSPFMLPVPPVNQFSIISRTVSCGCHQFVPCFPHGFAHQVCPNLGQGLQYHHTGALQVDSHQYSPNLGQGLQYHHTGALQHVQELRNNFSLAVSAFKASQDSTEQEGNSNAQGTSLTVTDKKETIVEFDEKHEGVGSLQGSHHKSNWEAVASVAPSLDSKEHEDNSNAQGTLMVAEQEKTPEESGERKGGVESVAEYIRQRKEELRRHHEVALALLDLVKGKEAISNAQETLIVTDQEETSEESGETSEGAESEAEEALANVKI